MRTTGRYSAPGRQVVTTYKAPELFPAVPPAVGESARPKVKPGHMPTELKRWGLPDQAS